ncbi:MAG TPA: choice-of-anchor tandem repeat GloVer-containing protein [Rhizomicrobium sp.]|nr:choice-of-anchor tandem repeat GloVer-containing protein [Rhizomicrobium sp.]
MTLILDVMRRAALAGTSAALLLAPSAHAGTHTVLYSFGTGGDGSGPAATMTNVNGALYGTTVGGGAYSAGAVFKAATTGGEKLVYSLKNSANDGAGPKSPVISVGGTFYGTTQYGGSTACSGGCGTVFGVTSKGAETVLYQFQGGSDGANPTAGLVNVGGTLYGTTFYGGGSSGYGTVFSITPQGVENVLYAFKGGSDGANPMGGLINVKGTLYGTTYTGGSSYYGTVFSLTTAGVKKTLYAFKNSSDGGYPESSLVNVGKKLYGVSLYGTNHVGTVYSLSLTGSFKKLYSFKGGLDGSEPNGGLINVGGTLYGVTWSGGSTTACSGYGCGTVFSVTPQGVETVVYAFQGGSDGLNPAAGLTAINGAIYGTTASGGTYYNGTVFSVTP